MRRIFVPPSDERIRQWLADATDASAETRARLVGYFQAIDYRARVDPETLASVRAAEPALADLVRAAGGSVRLSNALTCSVDAAGRLRLSLPA